MTKLQKGMCDRCHFIIAEGTVHIPTSRNGCQVKVNPLKPEVGPRDVSIDAEIAEPSQSGERAVHYEECAKIADRWAVSFVCTGHEDNPCCHVRTGAAIAAAIREAYLQAAKDHAKK
jgi:hypothetical protein